MNTSTATLIDSLSYVGIADGMAVIHAELTRLDGIACGADHRGDRITLEACREAAQDIGDALSQIGYAELADKAWDHAADWDA